MTSETTRKVDYTAMHTNHAFQIILLVVAFVANSWALVAFVGLVMIVGTISPSAALFTRIYRHVLKPLGIATPDLATDNPEPHRFSHGIGGTVLAGSTAALLLGAPVLGWVLVGMIIALTALNRAGFCVGCFIYYQLNKLDAPGFRHAPPDPDVLPGTRPRKVA